MSGVTASLPASPFDGGLFQFYDLDARTYRSVHWIWGYGPSVKLLLDATRIPEVAAQFPPGELVKIANEIGLMSTPTRAPEKRGTGTRRAGRWNGA